MRVIAINGSPRKNFNTATLLQFALNGASEMGAETALYHIGTMDFSPCKSCLACKSKKLPQTGRCVLNDCLTPVINDVLNADAIVLGSPIYFYTESASFRAFMERLLFPLTLYSKTERSLFKGIKPTGLTYSMNITEEETHERKPPFPAPFSLDIVTKTEYFFKRAFGNCSILLCTDTMQTKNYDAYHMEMFNAAEKIVRHEKVFPDDCRKAFLLGQKLVETVAQSN